MVSYKPGNSCRIGFKIYVVSPKGSGLTEPVLAMKLYFRQSNCGLELDAGFSGLKYK